MQTAADLVVAARGQVENLPPVAVAGELDAGGVVLVDVREPARSRRRPATRQRRPVSPTCSVACPGASPPTAL